MSESMGRTVTYFVVFAAAADGSARKTVQIYGEGKCTCHHKHGTKKKKTQSLTRKTVKLKHHARI